MTETMAPPEPRANATEWAVETHGLTKRFGDNLSLIHI